MIGIGTTFDILLLDTRAFCGRVFLGKTFLARVVAKHLDEHSIIDVSTECAFYGFQIRFQTVCGQLDAIGQS